MDKLPKLLGKEECQMKKKSIRCLGRESWIRDKVSLATLKKLLNALESVAPNVYALSDSGSKIRKMRFHTMVIILKVFGQMSLQKGYHRETNVYQNTKFE